MKRSNRTLALYLSVVFISGLLVGGLGYRLYTTEATAKAVVTENKRPTPEEWRNQYVSEMTKRLELSGEQLAQLNEILDDVKVQHDALERETHQAKKPKKRIIYERQVARTFAILTADQKVEYQKYRDELSARRHKRHEEAAKKKQGEDPTPSVTPSQSQ
jgi:hypothetical protein